MCFASPQWSRPTRDESSHAQGRRTRTRMLAPPPLSQVTPSTLFRWIRHLSSMEAQALERRSHRIVRYRRAPCTHLGPFSSLLSARRRRPRDPTNSRSPVQVSTRPPRRSQYSQARRPVLKRKKTRNEARVAVLAQSTMSPPPPARRCLGRRSALETERLSRFRVAASRNRSGKPLRESSYGNP